MLFPQDPRSMPWLHATAAIPALLSALCLILIAAGTARGQTTEAYIGQLVKPGAGNDSKARLEIRKATNLSFRPGAEGERRTQEAALLAGLSQQPDWEVKAYLMDEIRYGGKTASVEPLAVYLADADLCEPAMLALLSIGSTEGAAAILPSVRKALTGAAGRCRLTLLRAAGSLRDGAAATLDLLIIAASDPDRNVRAIALRGLANIGDARGRSALAEAMKTADLYERSQAIDLNLLFAVRLAERGLKSDAEAIANAIRTNGALEGRKNVVIHADSALASIRNAAVAIEGRPGSGREIAKAGAEGGLDFRIRGGDIRVTAREGGSFRIRIRDLGGRVVGGFPAGGTAAGTFDLGSLPAGMYTMAWEGGTGTGCRILLLP